MKKVLILSAVSVLIMSSCVKKYQCTCTYTPAGGTGIMQSYEINAKKKDAKETCNNVGASWIKNGGTCDFK